MLFSSREVSTYDYILPVIFGYIVSFNEEEIVKVFEGKIVNLLFSDCATLSCLASDLILMLARVHPDYGLPIVSQLIHKRNLVSVNIKQRFVAILYRTLKQLDLTKFKDRKAQFLNDINQSCDSFYQHLEYSSEEKLFEEFLSFFEKIQNCAAMQSDHLEAACFLAEKIDWKENDYMYIETLSSIVLHCLLTEEIFPAIDREDQLCIMRAALHVSLFFTPNVILEIMKCNHLETEPTMQLMLIQKNAKRIALCREVHKQILQSSMKVVSCSFTLHNYHHWIIFINDFVTCVRDVSVIKIILGVKENELCQMYSKFLSHKPTNCGQMVLNIGKESIDMEKSIR